MRELDPSYVAEGVYKGTSSLGKNVFGGLAHSASAISGTIGENLSALTLDSKYKERRGGGGEGKGGLWGGIGSGGQKVVGGFVEGVSGAISQPLRGAERSGASGFAKGMVRGTLGLFLKPIIGVADGVSDVLGGVSAGIYEGGEGGGEEGMGGGGKVGVLRPRRVIYEGGVVRKYDFAHATAASLLLQTSLRGCLYVCHFDFGARIVLCSDVGFLELTEKGEEGVSLAWSECQGAAAKRVKMEERGGREGLYWAVFVETRGGVREAIDCGEGKEGLVREMCELMERRIGD